MQTLTIKHQTVYHYRRPVKFGEHRLMFRPRDSHDLKLVSTALNVSPPTTRVHWYHDVFSNSIAIAEFSDKADELRFESRIVVEHYGVDGLDFPIEDYARTLPFSYPTEEVPDLGRTQERHYPDPDRLLDAWVRGFLSTTGPTETLPLLQRLTETVRADFGYERRAEPGTQSPVETLTRKAGSCRDFALLMMEAVRCLGLAARFVTGYLYDPAAASGLRGGGDPHAWMQVYLPGAGWLECDPTNGILGGANLVRVGVARDPSQAVPVKGTYFGDPGDFIDMNVDVRVAAAAD